jgi:hypothetical protein
MIRKYSFLYKYILLTLLIGFIPVKVFSQASTSLGIQARVIRIMTVNTTGANQLNFGNINVTNSNQNFSISNQNGQKFVATGSPNYIVFADWPNTVTLNNYAWVLANGGTNGTLTFTANNEIQHTGDNQNWVSPYDVYRNTYNWGNLYFRDNDNNGVGQLYFWLGGNLSVPANQPSGNYVGTLTFTVSY